MAHAPHAHAGEQLHASQPHASSLPQEEQTHAQRVAQVQEEQVQGEQAQVVVELVWADTGYLAG